MATPEKEMEYVSMYELFAKMFTHLAKEVVDRFGEEGKEAVRAGVWNFGFERGQNIAERAKLRGLPNTPEHYLTNYDMGRSDDFDATNTYGENQVEQLFTRCIFADMFTKDNMEEYGYLYCEMIDPSIAAGYNKDMECVHDKHFFKDGVCTFCFRLNQK